MALSDERLMLIDTSKCIGCRACQVACKQWHSMPAETTTFTGEYTNPPDFSGSTLTYVRFKEYTKNAGAPSEKPQWLFLKDQCRHCFRPKCARVCPTGVERTLEGFVIFNEECKEENMRYRRWMTQLQDACPYNVPRKSDLLERYVKCDFCYDRFAKGYAKTACELACPAGAIRTGSYNDVKTWSRARYRVLKPSYPLAKIYGGRYGRTNVLYILTDKPSKYGLV